MYSQCVLVMCTRVRVFQLSQQLAQYPYFTCPLEYSETPIDGQQCQTPAQFVPQEYALPSCLAALLSLVSGAETPSPPPPPPECDALLSGGTPAPPPQ